MKKLHILQTPARFYPNVGGVENYVLGLSEQLVKTGHEVKVICANEPKSEITEIKGISIERLKYIGKIANTNITFNLFFKLMREDFDIIHTHIPTPWSADISMLVSLIKRKPLILTYHNDLSKEGIESVLAKIYSATLLKLLFRNSKKIIVTNPNYIRRSKYLKSQTRKIEIIPNGINIKEFKPDTKVKREGNQIFFLSVLDKYHKYKGLDYLLKSMSKVIKQFPNVKLLIGGKGELVGEYGKLTKKLNISKNVIFLGYVDVDSLKRIYQESSIFVLPSINNNEGFGIVLLEAMACKTPVIATDIVGVAGEVKQNNCGIIIKPKVSLELAKAIIKILRNSKLARKMGENGRQLVQEKYSWKKIAKEIEGIYKDVNKKYKIN